MNLNYLCLIKNKNCRGLHFLMTKNKQNLFSAMLISTLFKMGKKFIKIGYYFKKNDEKFS